MIIVGNKIYETCPGCGQLIQINKWLLGSLHICAPEEERNARLTARHQRQSNPQILMAPMPLMEIVRQWKLEAKPPEDESLTSEVG